MGAARGSSGVSGKGLVKAVLGRAMEEEDTKVGVIIIRGMGVEATEEGMAVGEAITEDMGVGVVIMVDLEGVIMEVMVVVEEDTEEVMEGMVVMEEVTEGAMEDTEGMGVVVMEGTEGMGVVVMEETEGMGGQEKKKERKTRKSRSEKKVVDFSSAPLFHARKREAVTQEGTI